MPALLAITAMTLAACGGGHATAPAAAPAAVTAELATAERIDLPRRVELYGTVEAERTAEVSARVMAVVTAIHAQAGDAVRRGQLLAEIDPQTAAGQVAQARGGLGQARAALALAERNFQRYQALAAKDAASQLELDLARSQYEQAKGAVEQAEGAVSSASSVAGDSRVVAPFAGRVVRRRVEVGDLASPGPAAVRDRIGGRPALRGGGAGEPDRPPAASPPGAAVPVRLDARPELGRSAGRWSRPRRAPTRRSHTYTVKIALGGVAVASGASGRAALDRCPARPGRRWWCRRRRSSAAAASSWWCSATPTAGGDPGGHGGRAAGRRPGRGAVRSRRRRDRGGGPGGAAAGRGAARGAGREVVVSEGGPGVGAGPARDVAETRRAALRLKMERRPLGASGRIARAFLDSKLTPLLVVFSLFLGAFAVLVTPREEEPQIKVPMIDVFVGLPGAGAAEVERRVVTPLERAIAEIDDVEYVYSTSQPSGGIIIARFTVGSDPDRAVVRVHAKVAEVAPSLPAGARPAGGGAALDRRRAGGRLHALVDRRHASGPRRGGRRGQGRAGPPPAGGAR